MASQTPSAAAFTHFFVASQLLGAFFCSAVVLTALLSPRIHRNSTWVNYLITWTISALSYTLLVFAGAQTGPQPVYGLCFAQAVLLYGAPPLTAFSGISLIVQLYFDVAASLSGTPRADVRRNIVLLVAPYAGYVAVLLFAVAYGVNRPVSRTDDDTYCHVTDGQLGTVSAIIVALALLLSLVLIGYTASLFFRQRRSAGGAAPRASRVLLRSLVRVGAFTLVIATAIVVSIVSTSPTSSRTLFDGVLAVLPLLSFLIFGLQPDIIAVWAFWRAAPAAAPQGGARRGSAGSIASEAETAVHEHAGHRAKALEADAASA